MLPTSKCALPVEYDLGYPDYKIHAEVMPRILTCRFDALSKNYFPFKGFGPLLETPDECGGSSEPPLGHLWASVIPRFEQVQLVLAARHFPGQEITCGLQLATVEVSGRRVACGQSPLGPYCLLQPAPADHRVPEHLQVESRIGKSLI